MHDLASALAMAALVSEADLCLGFSPKTLSRVLSDAAEAFQPSHNSCMFYILQFLP